MKRKYIILLVVGLIIITVLIGVQLPQRIYTIQDFLDIEDNPSGNYVLMNDLDFDDYEFYKGISDLQGELNGNGFSLNNIQIEITTPSYETGVFKKNRGTIKNLNIDHLDIDLSSGILDNNSLVGGVVGWNQGTITNVEVSNSSISGVARNLYVGGIVGENDSTGTIKLVSSNVSILFPMTLGDVNSGNKVGGIAGVNSGSISDSMSKSTLLSNGIVAGIVGRQQNGVISNVYSNSSVVGSDVISGICGHYLSGDIINVLSNSTLTLENYNESSIMNQLVGKSDDTNKPISSAVVFIDAVMMYKYSTGEIDYKMVNPNNPNYIYVYKSNFTESLFSDYLQFKTESWIFTKSQYSYTVHIIL